MTLSDAFSWAFKDPQWLSKMLLQGLIAFIPIVGWIAMLGWLMMAIDNRRAGRTELPPAGFHLERGAPMFLVQIIYVLVLTVPGDIFLVLGIVVVIASGHQGGGQAGGTGLIVIGYLLYIAAGLVLRFLYPALLLNTNRAGVAGGLDVQKVWRLSTFNVGSAIIAALLILVAGIIGSAGLYLCIIGALFTIPYENTIIAGIVVWFEKESAAAS